MSISYELNNADSFLRIVVAVPTSIEDYQNVMPKMIREISDCGNVLLLIEVNNVLPNINPKAHDLGFYFINRIKTDIARLAIACPKELSQEADELTQLIRNHGRPAKIFQSASKARDWLLQ